jgi:hypothetical protein
MGRLPRWIAFAGLITLALFAALVLLVSVNRENHVAGPGEEFVYDDFAFRLLDAHRVDHIGDGSADAALPAGALLVRLQVDNRARRVSFDPRCFTPVVVLPGGRECRPSPEASRALQHDATDGGWEESLPASTSRVLECAFDAPVELHGAELVIEFGSFGRIADELLLGHRAFALP